MHPAPSADWFLFWKPTKYPFTFWYPPQTLEGHTVEVYEDGVPDTRILKVRSIEDGRRYLKVDWYYGDRPDPLEVRYKRRAPGNDPHIAPLVQTNFGGRPAWHFEYANHNSALAEYMVPFDGKWCDLTYSPHLWVSQQILANLSFHDLNASPPPAFSAPPRGIVPKSEVVGWQLFSSAGLPVQFLYPPRTALGAQVRCYQDSLWQRAGVTCLSLGTDEFYFEVTLHAPTDKIARFLADGAGSQRLTPITATTFGGRDAKTYEYQWGTRPRRVFIVPLGDQSCHVAFESDSEYAQQIAATLEFVENA